MALPTAMSPGWLPKGSTLTFPAVHRTLPPLVAPCSAVTQPQRGLTGTPQTALVALQQPVTFRSNRGTRQPRVAVSMRVVQVVAEPAPFFPNRHGRLARV